MYFELLLVIMRAPKGRIAEKGSQIVLFYIIPDISSNYSGFEISEIVTLSIVNFFTLENSRFTNKSTYYNQVFHKII